MKGKHEDPAYMKVESGLEWSRSCRTMATVFTLVLTVCSHASQYLLKEP